MEKSADWQFPVLCWLILGVLIAGLAGLWVNVSRQAIALEIVREMEARLERIEATVTRLETRNF